MTDDMPLSQAFFRIKKSESDSESDFSFMYCNDVF